VLYKDTSHRPAAVRDLEEEEEEEEEHLGGPLHLHLDHSNHPSR
jgi:hypothetical protein